jgi:transposase
VAKGYRPVDRDQVFLMPPSLRDWLEPGHLAWFVIDVVDQLDLSAFHAARRVGGAGRAAYDPAMMLALLVYAYCTGVRSSRRIEALCQVDVAYRVICAQDPPDHSTIARFRSDHERALKELFDQVLQLCARAGLGRLGVVALDSTKIAANASPEANRGEQWLRAAVDDMFVDAAAVDAAEDALFGADRRGDELPDELADPATRKQRLRRAYRRLKEEREQAEAAAAAQTQAEAARPPGRAQREAEERVARARQAHARAWQRAQARHEAMAQRRQAAHAAGLFYSGPRNPKRLDQYAEVRAATDKRDAAQATALQLARRREQALAVRDQRRQAEVARQARRARANTTDPDSRLLPLPGGGWIQGYNAQAVVSADHIVLATAVPACPSDAPSFISMMRAAQHAADLISAATNTAVRIGTLLADAGYDSHTNLTADGPDRLIAQTKHRHHTTAAHTNPAAGPPPEHATARQRMDHLLRTTDGQRRYNQRRSTVEPVFGQNKETRGFRRFTRRGATAVVSEWSFQATTHNLLKLHQHRQAT